MKLPDNVESNHNRTILRGASALLPVVYQLTGGNPCVIHALGVMLTLSRECHPEVGSDAGEVEHMRMTRRAAVQEMRESLKGAAVTLGKPSYVPVNHLTGEIL